MKRPTTTFLIALSSYWFTLTFIFGAVMSIIVPSLMETWFTDQEKGKFLGLAMGIGGAVATVSQLVAGAMSDQSSHRWGRRRPFILMGSTLSIVVFLLMAGGVDSYWHFVALLICAQVVLNIAAAPYTALLPDLVPQEAHGRAAGLMGIARILGEGAGIIVSARVIGKDPLHATGPHVVDVNQHLPSLMLLFSLLMVVTTTVILSTCKEEPLHHSDGITWKRAVGLVLQTSLRDYPDFTWLLISRAVINLGVYTIVSFLIYFVRHALHVDDYHEATGSLMAVVLVAGAVGSYPAGAVSDRLGRKWVIAIACGVTATAGVALVFASNLHFALTCGVVMGIGFGAFLSTDWAFACDLLPESDPARYLAVWNLAAALPQLVATSIAGHVAGWVSIGWGLGHAYRACFLLAVVYFIIGALLIAKVRETVQRRG